jgi:hypothetical protein
MERGFPILPVIQVMLIFLKLFDLTTMTWYQVFIPMYILLSLYVIGFLLGAVIYIVKTSDYDTEESEEQERSEEI